MSAAPQRSRSVRQHHVHTVLGLTGAAVMAVLGARTLAIAFRPPAPAAV